MQPLQEYQQQNNNQTKQKGGLVTANITMQSQQSPNAVQIGQLRKLGNANMQFNKSGGSGTNVIQMKHGNLIGMQQQIASQQHSEDAKNNLGSSTHNIMMMNTQRVHAAAMTGSSIEFCAEMVAPYSTKNIPIAGKKILASQQQISAQQTISSNTNSLGSGRRGAVGAQEEQIVTSAKKKTGNTQTIQQYQSASNQSTSNNQQQVKPKSKANQGLNQQSAIKNQVMLTAASQNAQFLSSVQTITQQKKPSQKTIQTSSNHHGQFGNFPTQEINAQMQGSTVLSKRVSDGHQQQNQQQKRDSSSNSEKLNNSLLKLKSRNRCNENLNIAGAPQGQAPEKQGSFSKKQISNKEGNKAEVGSCDSIHKQMNAYQEQQQKLNLSQEYLINPLIVTGNNNSSTVAQSQLTFKGGNQQENKLNTFEQYQTSSDTNLKNQTLIIPHSGSKQDSNYKPSSNVVRSDQRQMQGRECDSMKQAVQQSVTAVNQKNKNYTDVAGAGNSLERAINIQMPIFQQVNNKHLQQISAVHNKGIIPPQLDTSSEILKIGSSGLQNMKKLAMPLSSQNKDQQQILLKDNKFAILKNIQEGVPSSQLKQISIQIQNNTLGGLNSDGKQGFQKKNEEHRTDINLTNDNSSKSPSSNTRGNDSRLLSNQQITKVLKGQIKQANSNFDQDGYFLNTERIVIHPVSSKLSFSHEFPSSSVRECEMSTTINYTNAGAGMALGGDTGTSQTMVLSNAHDHDNSSLMGNSPHNQTLNAPAQNNTKNTSGSSIMQRRAAGSSQHIVSQLAPSQAKRRHYLKTGSVNQRTTTEENGHSSPSTGGGINVGAQNNASNSIGNKSQHYGLSSQSFLTNSNNSGSQTRDNPPIQAAVIPGPSSARLNSSSLGSSFYNHQRQKSGGFFQQVLAGNSIGANNNMQGVGQQNSKSITSQLNNSSIQGGGAISTLSNGANTASVILKNSVQNSNQTGIKQINFGAQNQELESSLHSIKGTLSGSSLNQAKIMAHSIHLMHNTQSTQQPQKLSLSSRPQYQQQIDSGNVMLKNKSKSSIKGVPAYKSSRLKSSDPSSSSRSNSIKKRTTSTNHKHSTTQAKGNEEHVFRNNFMLTSADEEEEPTSPINHEINKSMNTSTKAIKNTVEEVGVELQNTSSLSSSQQNSVNIPQQLRQSFSNDPRTYNPALRDNNKHQVSKVNDFKKSLIGPGMNRSVIVEPSQLIISKRGGKRGTLLQKNQQSSDQKTVLPNDKMQGIQEFELMKKELKSKDMLIQNLCDRILNLEEKVNGIQITQQVVVVENQRARNNRTTQEERSTSSERARDKSQQRIKEAILNLELKLEQFRQDKDLNHLRLQEIKQYSNSQHSSSRQSEQQLQLQNQKSLQQHLQTMIDAGLLHSPHAFASSGGRPQTYLLTSSSNDGGFATHTLGGPPRKMQKSQNSLMEDLESLITIGENINAIEAIGAPGLQRDRGVAHYYLEDYVGDCEGQKPIYYEGGFLLNSCGSKTAERQPMSKIKTPMFNNPLIIKNNLISGGTHNLNEDEEEDELKLFIPERSQNHEDSSDNEEQDNSCLLMLEKEWQEAQRQKLIAEGGGFASTHRGMFAENGSHHLPEAKNMSQLFDQSLIIDGGAGQTNKNMNQEQQSQQNGNTKNRQNIVFFFDEDNTLENAEDLAVGEAEEIAMAAQEGREKFVKTQKIEFSQKERISLGLNFPRKTGGLANRAQHDNNSLSPTSSDVINIGSSGGGGVRQQARKQQLKPSLNVVSSSGSNNNKQGQTSTNQAFQIQTQQQQQQTSGVVVGAPTFSRTLSKTTLAKIRNAIVKTTTNAGSSSYQTNNNFVEQTVVAVSGGGAGGHHTQKKKGNFSTAVGNSPNKTTTTQPRRFKIKTSQERNASTSYNNNNQVKNSNQNYQQVQTSSINTTIAIQPLKLKTKVNAGLGAGGRTTQDLVPDKTIGELHNQQQQEQLMKTIVQQKEKIALTQKDAIKKERELSLKLRQAIQKLNMKIHIQQTSVASQPQNMAATTTQTSGGGGGSANKKNGAK